MEDAMANVILTELREFREENNKRWEKNDERWKQNDRRCGVKIDFGHESVEML